jgi:predicted KAP-like P-loop ATPase
LSSQSGQASDRRGFDAAVSRREDDHLDRWPFAREIYGIATTGPKDWSVRLGVYGEWGTGKTSVLEFVADMAAKDRHVVIWFNPWQYGSKSELWRAFILTVFEGLERQLGSLPVARGAKRKAWLEKAGKIVQSVSAIANEKAGKVVDAGLELVIKPGSIIFSRNEQARRRHPLWPRYSATRKCSMGFGRRRPPNC